MVVKIGQVPNFDQLTEIQARDVLYDIVIPACERKGVMLSEYGNHSGEGSLVKVEKYTQDKAAYTLFNVSRVQRAFTELNAIIVNTSKYTANSYGLKHKVEASGRKEYLTNGDLIAAMLVKGYQARFGKRNEGLGVNCEFKVKYG